MANRVFNEFLSDFMQHNIVACPNCHKRADVRVLDNQIHKYVNTSPSKVTCLHCGYNKIWDYFARLSTTIALISTLTFFGKPETAK